MIAIFLTMLFLYIHIQHHLKKSDSMEVFDITVYSKDELEEVCNLRQPAVIQIAQDNFLCNVDLFDITKKYCSKTGSVHAKTSTNDNAELNISDTNTISGYYLKNNPDILSNHVDVEKSMAFIKPYMNVKSYTDCLIGGNDIITPLQQYLANRTYYSVCSGSLAIRLAPPKYTEKLSPKYDYSTLEFTSDVCAWDIDKNSDIDFLEITLNAGETLYVPPYWWCSAKLQDNCAAIICNFHTFMSSISILPTLGMYVLQHHNQIYKLAKRKDVMVVTSNKKSTKPNKNKSALKKTSKKVVISSDS